MDNLEFFTQFCHYLVVQIRAIVSDDSTRHTILAYKIVFDETHNHLFGNIGIRSSLYPFGKVVNCYQDETVSIRSFRFYHPDHVNTHIEKGHGEEITLRSVGGT